MLPKIEGAIAPRASTSIAHLLFKLNFKPKPAEAPIRALAFASPDVETPVLSPVLPS